MEKFERPKSLILPEKEPGSFAETMRFLRERVKRIRYNQLNFLSPKGEIFYNPTNDSYLLTNFYRNPSYPNAGSCHELSIALYNEILKKKDTTYKHVGTVVRCLGLDGGRDGINGYFSGEGSNHFFLVAFPDQYNFSSKYAPANDSIYSASGVLIDPSFGVVRPLESSSYTINTIIGTNTVIPKPKNMILNKNTTLPITFINGSPWSISYHSELGISLARQVFNNASGFYEFCYYAIKNRELDCLFASDRTLTHLIKSLRAKFDAVKVTDKPFEIEYTIH